MQIQLQRPEVWQHFNEAAREWLKIQTKGLSVQLFQGIHLGLFEVCYHLTQLFPHRNRVFYLKDCGPTLTPTVKWLSQAGLIVDGLSLNELNDRQYLATVLAKDTLLFLTCADDPLLGLKFECPILKDVLESARVYWLKVSHNRHWVEAEYHHLGAFQAQFLLLKNQWACGVFGSRLHVRAPLSENANWNLEHQSEAFQTQHNLISYQSEIESFENIPPAGASAILQGRPRVWDRSVLCFSGVDGHAVITALTSRLQLSLSPAGADLFFEAASASRWGGPQVLKWLEGLGLTKEQIRGLVLIDGAQVKSSLRPMLENIITDIKKIQDGDPWVRS